MQLKTGSINYNYIYNTINEYVTIDNRKTCVS